MKPLILTLIALFISLNGWAQTSTITYQGKLLDASGNPVTNSSMPMTFAIYSAETGGTKLWPSGSAAAKIVDVDYGLYTVTLGTGSGSDEAFTSAVFAGGSAWLEVSVNGTTLARTRLTTVPFSYFSGALEGKTWAAPGNIGTTTPGTGKFTNLTVGAYSFPSADGSNGQVLTTDGSGTLSWADASSFDPASPGNIGGTTPAAASFTGMDIEVQSTNPLLARGNTIANLDRPSSVWIRENYAYVITLNNYRLCIFDISNPDNPVPKGFVSLGGGVNSVHLSGNYAYVIVGTYLKIVDISNPDNPFVCDSRSTGSTGHATSVFISGSHAYVTSYGSIPLLIFDISNPSNIIRKDNISTNLSSPKSIYVKGIYAYVVNENNDRLCIFDISDPDNIIAKGYTSANLDYPRSVYVSGNYAYVASIQNDRLCVFDISDPDNIIAKGYTSANLDYPRSVYVSGNYAYVASYLNGRLCIFDICDPDNIIAKGYNDENLSRPTSVFVSGKYIFSTSQFTYGLSVYEINHLQSPAISAGSIGAGDMDIADNVKIGNNLDVCGGFNAWNANFQNNVGLGGTLSGSSATVSVDAAILNSLVVGSPRGGNLGDGSINAEAVYDDNVLLTDYVFDWYFGGSVLECDMDKHADYRMLSLQEMIDFTRENRHLPTITGRKEWEKYGKLPLGILTNQIWETVETQAIYIIQLKEQIDKFETENQEIRQENEKMKSEIEMIKEQLQMLIDEKK